MEKTEVQNIVEIFYLQFKCSLPFLEETCNVQRVFSVDSDKENLPVV